jgi:predicted TIM-barrel fold metal-dependent hydrolase
MAEPEDPEHLAWMIRMFDGGENLMFSTDYPHYDFDTPDELLGMLRGHFEESEIENVFGGTAARVFDLP